MISLKFPLTEPKLARKCTYFVLWHYLNPKFRLTGHDAFGGAFYCLNATLITVAFESNSGMVYGGYQSQVSAQPNLAACQNFNTAAKFIEV